ncbi:MAG: UTP--glucose-1-phosphate uridylyltransferase, partial [Promicromonosporaceae bacterium]|nr:UTP--glucose-1-phosphate uridylyltransferase [Promicromonosporaceae bacterium]
SDLYRLTEAYRLEAQAPAPLIRLGKAYRNVADFDARFASGVPSLREASSLTIDGDWNFGADTRALGDARLRDAGIPQTVPAGAVITRDGLAAG